MCKNHKSTKAAMSKGRNLRLKQSISDRKKPKLLKIKKERMQKNLNDSKTFNIAKNDNILKYFVKEENASLAKKQVKPTLRCLKVEFLGFFIDLNANKRLLLANNKIISLKVTLIKLVKLRTFNEFEELLQRLVKIKVNPTAQNLDEHVGKLTIPFKMFEAMDKPNVIYKLMFELEATSQFIFNNDAQRDGCNSSLRAITKIFIGEFDLFKELRKNLAYHDVYLREVSLAERNEPINYFVSQSCKHNRTRTSLKIRLNWLPAAKPSKESKLTCKDYNNNLLSKPEKLSHKIVPKSEENVAIRKTLKKEPKNGSTEQTERQYFDFSTNLPISANHLSFDFDKDSYIADKEIFSNLAELPVAANEKSFMKLWNSFILQQQTNFKANMPNICEKFIEDFGHNILENNLYKIFILHLCKLFEVKILTDLQVASLIFKIKSLTSNEFEAKINALAALKIKTAAKIEKIKNKNLLKRKKKLKVSATMETALKKEISNVNSLSMVLRSSAKKLTTMPTATNLNIKMEKFNGKFSNNSKHFLRSSNSNAANRAKLRKT